MRHSQKDAWHKGNYKQHSNVVEATNPDGSRYVVFKTAAPGFETDDAMRELIEWYNSDRETHTLVRSAIFVYDFLSIHPFQDGNGRLSRLLGTLLLLKNGYSWIQYVSFEHEIENRKADYYKVLMQCQRQRPGEDVYPWVTFFLDSLSSIQRHLINKLETKNNMARMTPRETQIYRFVENHPGSRSGQIAEKLAIPLPSVKRILAEMTNNRFLQKHGVGIGTNYTIESLNQVKNDLLFKLTNSDRRKVFTFMNRHSYIEVKKVILAPQFQWKIPDEWSSELLNQGLYFEVTGTSAKAAVVSQAYPISNYNHPSYFQPIFTLANPLNISSDLWDRSLDFNDYPLKITFELKGSTVEFDFDVLIVYDALIE